MKWVFDETVRINALHTPEGSIIRFNDHEIHLPKSKLETLYRVIAGGVKQESDFELVYEEWFDSAFEFMRVYKEQYAKLYEEGEFGEELDYYDVVDSLIEEYGSDMDLIAFVLSEIYPANQYLTLIDFHEDNVGSFQIRVWKVITK